MCRRIDCATCKKPTWAGCGNHIAMALDGVSEGKRCSGWRTGKCAGNTTTTTTAAAAAPVVCQPAAIPVSSGTRSGSGKSK